MLSRVAIFGGGGFIGRYVTALLAEKGLRLRLVSRSAAATALTTQGEVGQIVVMNADVADRAAVAAAVRGCEGVINLTGVLNPPFNRDFYRVHEQGAANIAAAAAEYGVSSLVHVSALGVDRKARSHYAASKLRGEKEVRRLFKKAVILRPSVVFGREDAFVINGLGRLVAYSPFLPVVGAGPRLKELSLKGLNIRWNKRGWRLQPVYVEDVAAATAKALLGNFASKLFELGGMRIYDFRKLLELYQAVEYRSRWLIPLPVLSIRLLAYLVGWLPYAPITPSQANMLRFDNIVAPGRDGFAALGLRPRGDLEVLAPDLLDRFKSAAARGQ